jgi:hypothetical protein
VCVGVVYMRVYRCVCVNGSVCGVCEDYTNIRSYLCVIVCDNEVDPLEENLDSRERMWIVR